MSVKVKSVHVRCASCSEGYTLVNWECVGTRHSIVMLFLISCVSAPSFFICKCSIFFFLLSCLYLSFTFQFLSITTPIVTSLHFFILCLAPLFPNNSFSQPLILNAHLFFFTSRFPLPSRYSIAFPSLIPILILHTPSGCMYIGQILPGRCVWR